MFSSVAAFAVVAAAGTYTYFRSGALTGNQEAWDGPRGVGEIAARRPLSPDSMPAPFGPPIIGGEQPWNASNFECIASGRSEVRSNGPESLTIGAASDAVSLYPFSVHSNLSFRARIEFLPGAKQPGTDGHAGLAFRASGRDDYYAASVFADGAYAVFHRIGDAWQAIVPKTNPEAGSAALKSGADVEVKLDPFTTAISVNGRTVPNLKIDGPAEGRLGYYVAAGHNPTDKWKFSNVLVRCGPPERNRQPAVRNDAKPSVVDVSAFSPEGGRPGEEILVQVFLHQPRQAAKAASLAQEADPDSRRRGVATLETEIAVGQKVEIRLDAPGLSVEDAIQQVTWRGEPRACQFLVTFPADAGGRSYPVRVRILVESVPVGKLTFQLRGAAPEQAVDTAAGLRGDKAQRYRQAFLSYSSADRVEVLKGAQYLKAAGIDFFQDLLSIEPGERWAARIFEEIDRCDLFLLCWSSNASGSEWVIKEAEYALRRHKASAEEMPDIIPLLLEGPPVPLPPPSLSDIHFNDPLRYVIFAEEQSRRTR